MTASGAWLVTRNLRHCIGTSLSNTRRPLSAVAGTDLRARQEIQEGTIERRLRACPLQHAQKRKGEISRETSPSLFRFSEIRFGLQITTLVIPESFGTHEQQPVLLPYSSVITLTARAFPTVVRFQLRGPSLVADSRRPPLVRSLLLEDHSSAESNTTLQQREC